MNPRSLDLIARAKGLTRSDLARIAGVSRQAVSGWLKGDKGEVAIRDRHLLALCRGLEVSPQELTEPFLDLAEDRRRYHADFLWDRLYPDVESFALALARAEPQALARLVSRVGLFEAAAVAGDPVWERFHDYARYLPPAQREELGRLWRLQSSLGLI